MTKNTNMTLCCVYFCDVRVIFDLIFWCQHYFGFSCVTRFIFLFKCLAFFWRPSATIIFLNRTRNYFMCFYYFFRPYFLNRKSSGWLIYMIATNTLIFWLCKRRRNEFRDQCNSMSHHLQILSSYFSLHRSMCLSPG